MITVGSVVRIKPIKKLKPFLHGREVEVKQVLRYPELDRLGNAIGSLPVFALVVNIEGKECVVNSDEVDEVATV